MTRSAYPIHNLYFSSEWQERIRTIWPDSREFSWRKKMGVALAERADAVLTDFESWPTDETIKKLQSGAPRVRPAVAIFRKLTLESRPDQLKTQGWLWVSSVSPWLDLVNPPAPDAKAMSNIRRREKRLIEEWGQIRFEVDSVPVSSWWLRFAAAQQNRRGEASVLSRASVRERFERWVTHSPQPEWMKRFEIWAGDEWLASALCYFHDGVFYYHLPAIRNDERVKSYGVGKLLVSRLIDWARGAGATTFDFLQGNEPYKQDWNPSSRALYQFEVPLNAAGKAVLMVRRRRLRELTIVDRI